MRTHSAEPIREMGGGGVCVSLLSLFFLSPIGRVLLYNKVDEPENKKKAIIVIRQFFPITKYLDYLDLHISPRNSLQSIGSIS